MKSHENSDTSEVKEEMFLFHATASRCKEQILTEGLREGSYWTNNLQLAEYYTSAVEDEGHEAILIARRLSSFSCDSLEPDFPGLEEPITTVVGLCEGEIWNRWQKGNGDWQSCLDLVFSLRCSTKISIAECDFRSPRLAP